MLINHTLWSHSEEVFPCLILPTLKCLKEGQVYIAIYVSTCIYLLRGGGGASIAILLCAGDQSLVEVKMLEHHCVLMWQCTSAVVVIGQLLVLRCSFLVSQNFVC